MKLIWEGDVPRVSVATWVNYMGIIPVIIAHRDLAVKTI